MKYWTQSEDDYLIDNWNSFDRMALALALDRTEDAVRKRSTKLGLPQKRRCLEWTDSEVAYLIANYSNEKIDLLKANLRDRDELAIKSKAGILGLSREDNRPWTNCELDYLMCNYALMDLDVLEENLKPRTKGAILDKATKLGLRQTISHDYWEQHELDFLLLNYSTMKKEDLRSNLKNRSWRAIMARASLLKIPRPRIPKIKLKINNPQPLNKSVFITEETINDIVAQNPNVGYIYTLKSLSGKYYVGQTWNLKLRLSTYRTLHERVKGQPKLYRALSKYGPANFECNIVAMCESQASLDEKECYFMDYYDSISSGYNIKEGGSGGKHSEETKIKIGNANRKRVYKPHTQETKDKISAAKKRNKI